MLGHYLHLYLAYSLKKFEPDYIIFFDVIQISYWRKHEIILFIHEKIMSLKSDT
jgi:hypothetical protein